MEIPKKRYTKAKKQATARTPTGRSEVPGMMKGLYQLQREISQIFVQLHMYENFKNQKRRVLKFSYKYHKNSEIDGKARQKIQLHIECKDKLVAERMHQITYELQMASLFPNMTILPLGQFSIAILLYSPITTSSAPLYRYLPSAFEANQTLFHSSG